MEARIILTQAQLLTIAGECSKDADEIRIAPDSPDMDGTVLATYDAGWGTMTLRVFPNGTDVVAGMGENVEKVSA